MISRIKERRARDTQASSNRSGFGIFHHLQPQQVNQTNQLLKNMLHVPTFKLSFRHCNPPTDFWVHARICENMRTYIQQTLVSILVPTKHWHSELCVLVGMAWESSFCATSLCQFHEKMAESSGSSRTSHTSGSHRQFLSSRLFYFLYTHSIRILEYTPIIYTFLCTCS